MGGGILCKKCGHQEAEHSVYINPEVAKSCPKYTPDINKGELRCTCANDRKWCNGFCRESKSSYSELD